MSRWSAFLDRVDAKLDRDIEREPAYSPGKPARPSASRYYFMASYVCEPCGTVNGCTCDGDKEES